MTDDPTTPGEIVGRNIRAMREGQLLSQRELAERSGVAKITIATMELGRSAHPRRRTVEKLAVALGVPVEELMSAEPPAPKAPAPPSQRSFENHLDEERREAEERYIRMPPEEFDELRQAANAGEMDGAKFHEAVLRAYNAIAAAYERARESADDPDDLEEMADLRREARKRWRVVMFDRAEEDIADDERRDPSSAGIERPDVRTLPLEEAHEVVRGRLRVTA